MLERVVGLEKLAEGPAEKPGRLRQAVSKILPFGTTAGPLTIKGHGDLLAYLAKCCNPLPGEEIVGYITRGRGVSVHRIDCPNVQNLLYNPEREIDVQWEQGKNEVYQVSLLIEVEDQQGMLARLTEAITRAGSNITADRGRHPQRDRPRHHQRRLPAPRPQAARQAAARGPRHLRRAAGRPPAEELLPEQGERARDVDRRVGADDDAHGHARRRSRFSTLPPKRSSASTGEQRQARRS